MKHGQAKYLETLSGQKQFIERAFGYQSAVNYVIYIYIGESIRITMMYDNYRHVGLTGS